MISIIIPIYNVEKYLRECLNSVYKLDLSDKEVILVNDGSTDNSLKIAEEYYQKYKKSTLLISQKNKGLSGARNTGIKNSKGKYLLFLDSDDFLEHKEVDFFCKEGLEKKQDILMGNFFYRYENKIIKSRGFHEGILDKTGLFILENFFKYSDFTSVVWKNLYNKKFLLENNLFFEEGLLHEDVLFTSKAIVLAKKVGYSKRYFYYYRQNNLTSIMNTLEEKNFFHMMYIINELIEFQKNLQTENKYFNRILIGLYWTIIKDGRLKNKILFDKIKKLQLNYKEKCKVVLIFLFSLRCKEMENIKRSISYLNEK